MLILHWFAFTAFMFVPMIYPDADSNKNLLLLMMFVPVIYSDADIPVKIMSD